jgi:type IV secretory pathway TraG/TraD family ATPase VirD4
MQADIDNLRSLRANGFAVEPTHGEAPKTGFTRYLNSWQGIALGIIVTVLAFFIFWAIFSFIHQDHKVLVGFTALEYGMNFGIWAILLYYAHPVFVVLFKMIKHGQWPSKVILSQYSTAQIYVSCIVFSLIACFLLNSAAGIIINLLHGPFSWGSRYIPSWWTYSVISVSMGIVLGFALPKILPYETQSRASKKRKSTPVAVDTSNIPFGLWVGRSTGYLADLWHRTGVAAGQDISLSLEDAAQNILVFGGIGSGKTTRIMQPLLAQLLEQQCGGLLFDIKGGDVKKAAFAIAKYCDVDIAVIGPGKDTWPINILGGLSPEIAASFLKSALLLSSGKDDRFWVGTATELCYSTLGVLSFIKGHYNLNSLYKYLFKDSFRDDILEKASLLLDSLEEEEKESLEGYMSYYEDVFTNFEEKMKKSVLATAAQVLSPFNTKPELIKAFCRDDSDTMDMTALFDRWIFLVDMPLSRWGLGAKLIYTFIKLRFFNMMQERINNPDWNQDRPVFLMCDEYQDIISANREGLSDLNFWDKSRSSKTIGIISSQSVSSFYAAIGDHDVANAVLQNFRQKFCFKTEDRATLTLMNDLAGQARVQKMTVSQGSTIGHDGKQSTSHNESMTEAREAVLDAPLFRQLEENRVVGLLSVNGRSMDDVFWVVPFYTEAYQEVI